MRTGGPVANLGISQSQVTMTTSSLGEWTMQGHLGHLDMTDLSPAANIYSHLLEIRGSETVEFKIQHLVNPQAGDPSYVATVKLKSISWIYVNRVIHEIKNYISTTQTMHALLSNTAAAVQERAMEAVDLLTKQSSTFKYEITLENPYIVVPHSAGSHQVIVLDLGWTTISNKFSQDADPQAALQESIHLVGRALNLSSGNFDSSSGLQYMNSIQASSQIVRNIDINIDYHSSPAKTETIVSTSQVHLALTEQQLALLLKVYTRNWVGDGHLSPPGSPSGAASPRRSLSMSRVSLGPSDKLSCLRFNVPKISLELHTYLYLTDHSLPPHPILGIYANSLVIDWNKNALLGEKTHLTVAALVAVDLRENEGFSGIASQFKTFFSPIITADSDTISAQYLRLVYTRPANTTQTSMTVDIDPSRLLIIPDAFFTYQEVLALFLKTYNEGMATLSVKSPPSQRSPRVIPFTLQEVDDTMSPPSVAPLSEEQAWNLEVSIHLQSGEVGLLEDFHRLDSRAIVAKGSVELGYRSNEQKQQFTLSSNHWEGYLCTWLHQEDSAVSIIPPFDMKMEYTSTPTSVHAICKVEALHVVVSYRDFKSMSNIITNLKASSTGRDPANEILGDIALSSLVKAEYLKVEWSGVLRVTIIDDLVAKSAPLIDLFWEKPFIEVNNWSSQPGLLVTFQLVINYYNDNVQRWEPMIESWSFQFKMGATRDGGYHYALLSNDFLNVNITLAFLHMITRSWKGWEEDFYRSSSIGASRGGSRSSALHLSPYYIRNDTGQTLWYWLGNQAVRELQQGAEEPLLLTDESPRRARRIHRIRDHPTTQADQTISFQIQGEYKPVSNIPIDKVGSYVLHINPEDYSITVIYEVSFRGGSKILTVKSPLVIANDTDYLVQVKATLASQSQELGPIAPRSSLAMPVAYAQYGSLQFRPIHQHDLVAEEMLHQWSEELPCKYIGRKSFLRCSPVPPHSASFTFSLLGTQHTEGKIVKVPTLPHRQKLVTLGAPIILENLLAAPINYKIVDIPSGVLIERGSIDNSKHISVHQIQPNQILGLSIQIKGYKWSKIEPLNGDMPSNVVKLADEKNRILDVNIDYSIMGVYQRRVILYCDYWLVNSTGLKLIFGYNYGRATAAGQSESDWEEYWNAMVSDKGADPRDCWHFDDCLKGTHVEPLMFCFPSSEHSTCFIRTPDSNWSNEAITFDSTGLLGAVHLVSKKGHQHLRCYEITVSIDYSPAPELWRTKMVSFAPCFTLVNKTTEALYLRQCAPLVQGGPAHDMEACSLLPKERSIWHWPNARAPHLLQVSMQSSGWEWSGKFSIQAVDNFALKLRNPSTNERYLLRVQIKIEKSTTLVIFTPEDPKLPPYRIRNDTPKPIVVNQKGIDRFETVNAHSDIPWGWDEPSSPHILMINIENELMSCKLDKVKKSVQWTSRGSMDQSASETPTTALNRSRSHSSATRGSTPGLSPLIRRKGSWRWEVSLDGPTKMLTVSPPSQSSQSLRSSFEQKETKRSEVLIVIEGIGISLIDETPQELMYASLDKINLEYSDTSEVLNWELVIKSIQIDNQLYNAPYGVLLATASQSTTQPAIHVTVIKSNRYTEVNYFKYLSALIQEVNVQLDEEFLIRFVNFFARASRLVSSPQEDYRDPASAEKMIYFELFHLNPIKANLTFMAIPGLAQKYAINASMLLGISTKLLVNVDHAPLEINGLLLKNPFLTRGDLTDRIWKHYTSQSVRQIYKVLGSMEFLGSPVSLFTNIGTGFYDFFYEPAKGIVKSPKEFGKGVAKGTTSLIQNSAYGIFNATSKITGSIGTGIAHLSMDPEYMKDRQERNIRTKPKHVGEGVLYGARDLGLGLFKGVTGLIEEPIKGASQGMGGFVKGLGRGVVGVAVKPMVGIMDFATQTGIGARNTAVLKDPKFLQRRRSPRYFGPDKILEPFSPLKSEGAWILKTISKGRYKDEEYKYHIHLNHPKLGALLFLASSETLFLRRGRNLEKLWKQKISNCKPNLEVTSKGIVIHLKTGQPPLREIIPCHDSVVLQQIFLALAPIVAAAAEAKR
eukprot:TRINITY_DN5016_c0_g2_i3.p1 TRINITY_DN5016_c0_g2~~TRINITY_DN5016_c0_g2_i3.p1  ORF type:complete len:2265 (-),score=532.32 TRINITY_DN5016_c0_g2_i3:78-6224(-)